MINADKVKEDIEIIRENYGANTTIEVGDEYYICYIDSSIGSFKFLLTENRLDNPYALSYVDTNIKEAIKKLQEI